MGNCIYTYNGKEYSEHEFKHLLLSGELDNFLPDDVEMPPVSEKQASKVSQPEEKKSEVPKAKSKLAKFKEKHLSQSKTDVNGEAAKTSSDETGRESEEKVNAFEKHGLSGTKTVDEIYNTPDAPLSDLLEATEQSYADAHHIISDYGNRILDLNKELKVTKNKSEKAVIKARLEELAKERAQLEAEVEQRQMIFFEYLEAKVIARAKELGHKLSKAQEVELSQYALPYLTEGRMMENIYLTKTVQGLTDELINEYFAEKEESEPAAEKTEAPLSDRIKNINEERQQKINEVTKPEFSFETGLTVNELADTTEENRQKNTDFKSQLAAIKKIADCLWT